MVRRELRPLAVAEADRQSSVRVAAEGRMGDAFLRTEGALQNAQPVVGAGPRPSAFSVAVEEEGVQAGSGSPLCSSPALAGARLQTCQRRR